MFALVESAWSRRAELNLTDLGHKLKGRDKWSGLWDCLLEGRLPDDSGFRGILLEFESMLEGVKELSFEYKIALFDRAFLSFLR